MVLAGIECSQKSVIFANGIPVGERVEKVDTLKLYYPASVIAARQQIRNGIGIKEIIKRFIKLAPHGNSTTAICRFAGNGIILKTGDRG